MPKEITDIRDFLQKARRRDAKAVTIKTTRGMTKFKIRCSRYLYTLRVQDGEKAATDKIKSQGMKVINFSADDKKVFDTAFKSVAQDWVKDVDKRGKPGSEVFKAFTEALATTH